MVGNRWANDTMRSAPRIMPALICALLACQSADQPGANSDPDADDPSGGEGSIPEDAKDEVAVTGLRRLSVVEYVQTATDLVGVAPTSAQSLLPPDTLGPFDNDYGQQIASEPLIKGLELLSMELGDEVAGSAELRETLVPCQPTGPQDAACFEEFLRAFGRRALRRSLRDEEVMRFGMLLEHGVNSGDFWVAVGAAVQMFLQHPELVYRVELGEPVADAPGVFELSGNEVATRLSYLILGTTPPLWLIDAAEAGELRRAEDVRAVATELLDDPRARERIARFHGLWLGYESMSREGLGAAMQEETRALVERVVFDERGPWTDILTSPDTYASAELARHYGLDASEGQWPRWVDYGDSGRSGLLSHGSFLAVRAKFGDTSPTQRGLLVRTRLFCQDIPAPPPDLMVDVDEPPMGEGPDACKADRYTMWEDPSCAACHLLMDPIGFGLEQYDASGAFRDVESGKPQCEIDGKGNVSGVGEFNGPAELGELAVESGLVERCVATQLYRFSVGRLELDDFDQTLIDRVVENAGGEFRMHDFILDYVGSDAFRFRREET